jgi:hypothetical protein
MHALRGATAKGLRLICAAAIAIATVTGGKRAFAQEPHNQDDYQAVYGIGWSGDWSRDGGLHATGATVGVEITPVENWLSIETSVGASRVNGVTEMPIEVAFRKPLQLSPKVELMGGAAPELVHRFGARAETFPGISFGGHVMVWPRRGIGWFAEGAYELGFPRDGVEKGVEFSAGVLIGR